MTEIINNLSLILQKKNRIIYGLREQLIRATDTAGRELAELIRAADAERADLTATLEKVQAERDAAVSDLARIAEILEEVDRRAMFGATIIPTLQEMEQSEISAIYALAKGKPESWRPHDER